MWLHRFEALRRVKVIDQCCYHLLVCEEFYDLGVRPTSPMQQGPSFMIVFGAA